MSANTTPTDTNPIEENWAVEYDAEPIQIRDPVAEALGVLEAGDPFEITYQDVVKAAGHSCPTASGAFRIVQVALDALYTDEVPVRSDIEVRAAGPRHDSTYGVMGRLISYMTGAAQEDGFGGLGDGLGDRRNLLLFDAFESDTPAPTFRFRRTDTDETVEVTYHLSEVPDAGSVMAYLQDILAGSASDEQRDMFYEAWHGRVQVVLSDDSLFTAQSLDAGSG